MALRPLGNPWEALLGWLARMDPSRREILLASLALLVLFGTGERKEATSGWRSSNGTCGMPAALMRA